MRIALISLDQAWQDKPANERQCAHWVDAAAQAGAEMVVFPEMTLTGYSMAVEQIAEEPANSPSLEFFKDLSKNRLAIAFGIVHQGPKGPKNQMIVVGDDGTVLANYAKIHPFTLAGENKYFQSGDSLAVFPWADTRVGCSICYDLRFPTLFQNMTPQAEVILNIANWPAVRVSHWETLLRARAIENQCFFLGVNRTGRDGNGIEYLRSSQAYSPWGELLQPCESLGEMDLYDLDAAEARTARAKLSVIADRRPGFYAELSKNS